MLKCWRVAGKKAAPDEAVRQKKWVRTKRRGPAGGFERFFRRSACWQAERHMSKHLEKKSLPGFLLKLSGNRRLSRRRECCCLRVITSLEKKEVFLRSHPIQLFFLCPSSPSPPRGDTRSPAPSELIAAMARRQRRELHQGSSGGGGRLPACLTLDSLWRQLFPKTWGDDLKRRIFYFLFFFLSQKLHPPPVFSRLLKFSPGTQKPSILEMKRRRFGEKILYPFEQHHLCAAGVGRRSVQPDVKAGGLTEC